MTKWLVFYKYEDNDWMPIPTWENGVMADNIEKALLVIRDWFHNSHKRMDEYNFIAEPYDEEKDQVTPDSTEGIPGRFIEQYEENEDRRNFMVFSKRRRGREARFVNKKRYKAPDLNALDAFSGVPKATTYKKGNKYIIKKDNNDPKNDNKVPKKKSA